MNQFLIERHNAMVTPDDTTIMCGDFGFYCAVAKGKSILDQLNGKKILVRGNHDSKRTKMLRMGFDWVCDSMELELEGKRVLFSHYPYRPSKWDIWKTKYLQRRFLDTRKMNKRLPKQDLWLIHGHIHDQGWKICTKTKQINVGVDAWNFYPVPLGAIAKYINGTY